MRGNATELVLFILSIPRPATIFSTRESGKTVSATVKEPHSDMIRAFFEVELLPSYCTGEATAASDLLTTSM
jgi:hypothetical protein